MISVAADHLNFHAGHASQQPIQDLLEIIPDSRLQDPPAIFAYPYYVILKTICTVSSQSYFHTSRTYRLRAHSSTGKPVVFCLRPHKILRGNARNYEHNSIIYTPVLTNFCPEKDSRDCGFISERQEGSSTSILFILRIMPMEISFRGYLYFKLPA